MSLTIKKILKVAQEESAKALLFIHNDGRRDVFMKFGIDDTSVAAGIHTLEQCDDLVSAVIIDENDKETYYNLTV